MGGTSTTGRTYVIEGITCGRYELSVKEQPEELRGIESSGTRCDWTTGWSGA